MIKLFNSTVFDCFNNPFPEQLYEEYDGGITNTRVANSQCISLFSGKCMAKENEVDLFLGLLF